MNAFQYTTSGLLENPFYLRNLMTDIEFFKPKYSIVTHRLISAQANIRPSIARQRISKYASLMVEAVFLAWSVQSGYKEV
jgi:hypothetical protein